MKAMVLKEICSLEKNRTPLEMMDLPSPVPGERDVLIRVSTCGVCHTELDEIEGRTPPPRLPVVLGHQAVGRVERTGHKSKDLESGRPGWGGLDLFGLRQMQVLPRRK